LDSPRHGRDSAARDTDIAQQQLNNAHGSDVLNAYRMLSPAHGIEFNTRLIGLAR